MKKLLAGLMLLAATCAQATATFGDIDCGRWVSEQGPRKLQYRAWLMGYMSGLAMGSAGQKFIRSKDPLDKIDSAEQIFLWMDNYCRANPLKKLSDGGLDLFIELDLK